ncbi:MAG TPA: hypothetical protein VFG00_00450 [Acidothermaceae bacterium]|nr:hypothetical protein [Acidothermaceae bacterium]
MVQMAEDVSTTSEDAVVDALEGRAAALAEAVEYRRRADEIEAEVAAVDRWWLSRGCPVELRGV